MSQPRSEQDLSAHADRKDQLNKEPILSVLMPAHNEADIIKDTATSLYHEIAGRLPIEFIVAEDGSVDGTREILTSMQHEIPMILLFDHNRKGYSRGVSDALKQSRSDLVFFSDSDGQYVPSNFWNLWSERSGYDMIIGCKVQRRESLYRIILAKGFHRIANTLFGLNLHDMDCGYRLIRRKVIDSVINETKYLDYSFWAEFTIRASLKGFKVREVPVTHNDRQQGGTRIYSPSKVPLIIMKQLRGLLRLYRDVRKNNLA